MRSNVHSSLESAVLRLRKTRDGGGEADMGEGGTRVEGERRGGWVGGRGSRACGKGKDRHGYDK